VGVYLFMLLFFHVHDLHLLSSVPEPVRPLGQLSYLIDDFRRRLKGKG
jgi:hypothetical protein